MVDGVGKRKYRPKVFVFNDRFNPEIHNEWIGDHSWEIYNEFFRCVRWWVKNRRATNFPYVIIKFTDFVFNIYFRIDEMEDTFNYAIRYFEKNEDYEMCAYIKHLADDLKIQIKKH